MGKKLTLLGAALLLLLTQPLFKGVEAAYIPSVIKSINHISIGVSGVTSNTQTVSSVNLCCTALIANVMSSIVVPPNQGLVLGTITNSTTITASKNASTGQAQFSGELIEFGASFVKSRGCGTIDLLDTVSSNTATITSVNTAKTAVFYTGGTSTVTSGTSLTITQAQQVNLTLTNATTITASRLSSSGEVLSGYCYIEFK